MKVMLKFSNRLSRCRPALLLGVAAGVVLIVFFHFNSVAQDAAGGVGHVKDFFVPDFYPPPHQNQMKSLLRGAEAEPQPNRCVRIRDLTVETFKVDGKPEMNVHAPECLYNSLDQTASSAGWVTIRSSDGQLLVEGEGFYWRNTNSTFILSNRVHTLIKPLPKTAGPL